MEKKSGQKFCSFSSIYQMKEEKDIPCYFPFGVSKEWKIEFYTQCCHILKDKNKERYDFCYDKLMELVRGESDETK